MPIPFLSSIGLNKNEVQDFKVFNLASDPTLTSGGDFGYFWLNTSGTKNLKFWDGANIRSLIDSTTIGSATAGLATDLAGGGAGQVVYQNGSNDTQFLAAGSAGQVLSSNGSSAPSWLNQSSITAGSVANALTAGTYLTSGGTYDGSVARTFAVDATNANTSSKIVARDAYGNFSAGTITAALSGNATTATTATNVSGGTSGALLYQSATNFTTNLSLGGAGQVLKVNTGATAPEWVDQSTLSVGSATTATTANAVANALTAGTYLTSGGTYNGSAARTFAVDATDANTASKVVARDASGNFAAGTITAATITGLSAPTLGSDATNKDYVDGVVQGLDIKASCLVATTTDITLSAPGSITIDGVVSSTDFTTGVTRILVKDQSAPAENGIYIWQGPAAAMTRSADANTWDELVAAFTFIERGTANADSGWVCNVNAGGTLGTTAVTWTKFSQAGSYTANRGLVLSGGAFNFAQNSDYTIGDLPYATGGTTIGLLADVATGNALISGGVATAPSWGKIGLTTHVSGTLPIANGGTGITSFGAGIATFLETPSSANLATAVTDETGTGKLVFATSPTLEGTPLSTTATADTNTTQIATTAYVVGQASSTTPEALGTAAVGTSLKYARADHVHALPTINLASGVTGTLPVGNGGTGAATFTAGRVLFGNGTSAINTSANLFWDNSNNRLGIGTATPSVALDVNGSAYFRAASAILGSGTPFEWISTYPNRTQAYQSAGNDFVINNISSGGLLWYLNNSLKLTLDTNGYLYTAANGRIGVGVSPVAPLHILSSASELGLFVSSGAGSYISFRHSTSSVAGYLGNGSAVVTGGGNGDFALRSQGNLFLASNGDNIRATINTSGNLGLGVTPSAWASGWKAFDVGNTGSVVWPNNNSALYLLANSYYNGTNWIYKQNAQAGLYLMVSGQHQWHTAASGIAGNAISFTQSMTLDASGNLCVGTASAKNTASGRGNVTIEGTSSAILNLSVNNSDTGYLFHDGTNIALDNKANGYVRFSSNNTERLRIKATGQLNFTGLAADPAGAAGDLYYYSTGNYFKWHNGTAWQTFPRKYVVQLSDGSVTVVGNAYTLTHNLGSKDVTVTIRRTTDDAVILADVTMPSTTTATITFAAAITAANFYVTVIG